MYLIFFLDVYCRKVKSESGDDDSKCENEDLAVSDSTAIKEGEKNSSNLSLDEDNEQVDSSTTEPLVAETKDESNEKSESEKTTDDNEKKETQDEQVTDTPTPAKKKTPSRKRPSKSSSSKSSRSPK